MAPPVGATEPSGPGAGQRSTLDRILHRRRVRIAVAWQPPPETGTTPQMYLDPLTGAPSGVLPDLGRLLAQDLGAEAEFVDLPWDEHLSAVLDGRVDLLLSFTNTPERALQLEFSRPLLPHEVLVLVPEPEGVQALEELLTPGHTVSAPASTSLVEVARRRFPKARVLEVAEPWLEVEQGRADASVEDAVTKVFLRHHPGLRPLRNGDGTLEVISREYGHPAIRPGDRRFLNWLDNWVRYQDAQGNLERLCHAVLRESWAS